MDRPRALENVSLKADHEEFALCRNQDSRYHLNLILVSGQFLPRKFLQCTNQTGFNTFFFAEFYT